ncbi:NifU N-terminal domain-containing protein [Radiobacillus sp. PE A8.2]|uniref:NifU N-terminal domain-containing protein n=1 Tax=Radiobacillus sp. PE A8.2 TaxID=3380349 RepID=UPI00388E24B6
MTIQVDATPNPNALKFTSDKMIFQGDKSFSVMPGQTSEFAVLNELMELDGVDNVFGFQNFITVNKLFDAEWDGLTVKVENVLIKHGL